MGRTYKRRHKPGPRELVIFGPRGSGKSQLALALALEGHAIEATTSTYSKPDRHIFALRSAPLKVINALRQRGHQPEMAGRHVHVHLRSHA